MPGIQSFMMKVCRIRALNHELPFQEFRDV